MTTPAISIATSFDYAIPFEEQAPLIAQAGFTHLSLGAREDHSHYRSAAGRARIAALLRADGLALDTIHGRAWISPTAHASSPTSLRLRQRLAPARSTGWTRPSSAPAMTPRTIRSADRGRSVCWSSGATA